MLILHLCDHTLRVGSVTLREGVALMTTAAMCLCPLNCWNFALLTKPF